MNGDLFDAGGDEWSMWITLSRVPPEQRDRLGDLAVSEEYASSGLIILLGLDDAEDAIKRFSKEIAAAEEVTVRVKRLGGDNSYASVNVNDYGTGFEAGMAAYRKAFDFRVSQQTSA